MRQHGSLRHKLKRRESGYYPPLVCSLIFHTPCKIIVGQVPWEADSKVSIRCRKFIRAHSQNQCLRRRKGSRTGQGRCLLLWCNLDKGLSQPREFWSMAGPDSCPKLGQWLRFYASVLTGHWMWTASNKEDVTLGKSPFLQQGFCQ